MLDEIRRLAAERAEAWPGELLEMNGEAHHVHVVLSLSPHARVSEFVSAPKTNTSWLLRRDYKRELARRYCKPML